MAERIDVRLLHPAARMPEKATDGATGFDLYACLPDGALNVGNAPVSVPTGVAISAPAGLDVQIRPRSGLARKGVLCSFGTIDADYRGELLVTMYSISPDILHEVRDGDRIAQLVVSRVVEVSMAAVDELPETARGNRGFGSTGR